MLYFHFDQVDVECVAQRLNHDATNGQQRQARK